MRRQTDIDIMEERHRSEMNELRNKVAFQNKLDSMTMKMKNLTIEVKKEKSKPDSHYYTREERKKNRIIGK